MFQVFRDNMYLSWKQINSYKYRKNTIQLAKTRGINYLFDVNLRVSYLGHLLLPLCFGCLSVGIVVRLDQDKVVGLWVNDKFPGSVLQGEGHLVENGS